LRFGAAALGRAATLGRAAALGPAAAIALLALCAGARADEQRAQVEQRIALGARLLADEASIRRIEGSGVRDAQAQLDNSRVRHALAAEALQRGDLGAARREADEALRLVALARRLVPDREARQAAARQRYEQVAAALERLLAAWRQEIAPASRAAAAAPGAAAEAPAGAVGAAPANGPVALPADAPADGDGLAAIALMETARRFAALGRHEDALFTLASAESHVLALMRRQWGARELDYTQRAGTPAEEFQLELQRHQALADLLPLALKELRPAPAVAAQADRYAEAGKSLLARAIAQHESGQAVDGLVTLRNASLLVQRALHAAGLSVPGAPPLNPTP
jgi:hypothetical protein